MLLMTTTGCTFANHYVFSTRTESAAAAPNCTLPFEEIWFRSTDGVLLNGRFFEGTPGSPLILFFHGNSSNLDDNLEYLKLLHGHGFAIFIFDYRGYGKSHGEPLYENDLYQDARGAIAYLDGRGLRHEQTIYFGQSLGAAVALQMAQEEPPAGLAMESSFTNLSDIVRHYVPVVYFMIGWSMKLGMDLRFDSLAKIGDVNVPLLLIHGDNDQVAPVEMARRLFARASEPKMLQIMSGGKHCDASTLNIAQYLASWDRFISAPSVRVRLENPAPMLAARGGT